MTLDNKNQVYWKKSRLFICLLTSYVIPNIDFNVSTADTSMPSFIAFLFKRFFFKLKGDSFLRNTYPQTASKHLTQNAFAKFVKLAGFSLFNIWKTCKCLKVLLGKYQLLEIWLLKTGFLSWKQLNPYIRSLVFDIFQKKKILKEIEIEIFQLG